MLLPVPGAYREPPSGDSAARRAEPRSWLFAQPPAPPLATQPPVSGACVSVPVARSRWKMPIIAECVYRWRPSALIISVEPLVPRATAQPVDASAARQPAIPGFCVRRPVDGSRSNTVTAVAPTTYT